MFATNALRVVMQTGPYDHCNVTTPATRRDPDILVVLAGRPDRIDSMNVASEEQFTNVYGARALVGWTWRLSDWWFLALSVGGSADYERGREKVFTGYDFSHNPPDLIREGRVSRVALSSEAYLRVGMAFGQ